MIAARGRLPAIDVLRGVLMALIWIAVVGLMAFACRWYGRYKQAHPSRWLTDLL